VEQWGSSLLKCLLNTWWFSNKVLNSIQLIIVKIHYELCWYCIILFFSSFVFRGVRRGLHLILIRSRIREGCVECWV
jgi:hypothetical protein